MNNVLLKAENIHKVYKSKESEIAVLKGINLTIAQAETLAIVGPSGAGKSTLLHILGALDQPSEGRVEFDSQDLYQLNDIKRAQIRSERIGFIFQFYHLLPEFTALENVVLPGIVKSDLNSIEPVKQRGLDLLKKVGLENRATHRPNQLSGGEQQRVAIARALMNQPKIIFCDEPTGNLDSQNGDKIIDLLIQLNKDNAQTLVIVTHDENIARRAHKTIFLKDGVVVEKQFMSSP